MGLVCSSHSLQWGWLLDGWIKSCDEEWLLGRFQILISGLNSSSLSVSDWTQVLGPEIFIIVEGPSWLYLEMYDSSQGDALGGSVHHILSYLMQYFRIIHTFARNSSTSDIIVFIVHNHITLGQPFHSHWIAHYAWQVTFCWEYGRTNG